eukprot:g3572.t1
MSLSDYPFDVHFPGSEDPRCFPSRAEVLRYLDAFRKDYRLDQYISYETEVLNVAHDDDNDDVEENQWKIRIQSENEVRDFVFDAIAVCNGHYTVPNLPKITNISNFGKPCFHSHLYRNPESFRNKNILILGNGPSGNDISLEIAEVANKVYFCGRKWGSDIDLSKPMGSKGNVYLHTNINNCPARGSIQLEDGTVLTDVDEIMLCTGYVYNFPFLKNINGVEADGSYVFPVYKHVIDIHKPSLAYIGLPWRIIPFPLCEFQSKYFAKILTGKCLLPDANEMINDILCRQNKLKELKLDDRYYHMLGMDQFSYLDELASLCGDTSKLSSWRYNSYLLTGVLKREHRLNYRDQPFNEQLLSEAQMEFDSLRDNSTVRVDCSGRSWNCDRGRERTEEVVHRMVAHILTESSLSQNNGSSDSSEQSYMPRRWLQRNCNYSDASNESSDDNDSNEETKPTGCLENITLGQRSHHLSVSEGLQSLAWRLRKGVGTDCRRSASDSKSDVTERCPGYSIHHDCKERLEYLTSKLDSWDENEDSIQFDSNVKIGRSTSDNLANCKVVLSDSRSDENALVGAFGSIMETNNSSIGDSNKYKEANSVKIEREVDQLEDENLNQQNSFCGNTEDELFNHSPLPVEQTPNVLRENETSKSSKTKAKDRLRSKSRASKSRRSKKRSSRERRFKKVVENEVLPGIRFEQVRSAIPKATLTTPVTSIRKNSILNIESESVINRKESTKPRSLMPKDLVEEAKDYEAKPKNIVYSNPNTAMQMTATNDMNSTDAATNKEAKEATETVNNAKHVFPSSSERHHTKKPSKNNFGEQSKRRSKSSISQKKTVVVTGCSTGIGEDVSKLLASKDWIVFAGVRKQSDAVRLRSYNSNIKPLILDVTKQDQVDAAFAEVSREVGAAGLDALVNNAGLGILGPSEFTPVSEFQKQYDINVFGLIRVTQAAMPLLRKGEPGQIVNVSSIAPNMNVPFGGVYCPTKGAVDSFSECFKMEVMKWGIKVSVLKPGPVRTAFSDTALDAAKAIRNRFDKNSKCIEYYGETLDKFPEMAKRFDHPAPPSKSSAVIYNILTSQSPRFVYFDTWGTFFTVKILNMLPKFLYYKLMSTFMS